MCILKCVDCWRNRRVRIRCPSRFVRCNRFFGYNVCINCSDGPGKENVDPNAEAAIGRIAMLRGDALNADTEEDD